MTKSKTLTTPAVVKRVQSTTAKQHEGMVPKGHYVGRMQRTIAQAAPTKSQQRAPQKQAQTGAQRVSASKASSG